MINVTNEWLMPLNIGTAVILFLYVIAGWKKGFLHEMVGLAGTVVSFWGSWHLSEVLTRYIMLWPEKWIPEGAPEFSVTAVPYLNRMCWFVALFLVFRILCMILSHVTKKLQEVPLIHELSAICGGILGLAEGVVAVVVLTLVLNMPVFAGGSDAVDRTLPGQIRDIAADVFKEYGEPILHSKDIAKLYENASQFTEQEKDALEKWLIDNGYGNTEESTDNAE